MRKTFRSAIGWIMIIPLALLIGVMLLVLAIEPHKWPALLIIFPIVAFIVHMLMNTDYTLDGGQLRIRCGFFRVQAIDISSITRITETRNPLSSPALSLDRLDIQYRERHHVMISPKDKEEFIAAIREIHPSVVIRRSKPRTETFSA